MIIGQTTKNIMANYFGQAVAMVLGLVAVPIYLHFLGVAAYGLIGIFMSLQSLALMLDLGLGATFIRETAALHTLRQYNKFWRIFLTFEIAFFAMGGLIALVVAVAAPFIAQHWVTTHSLSTESVTNAIRLMGVAIGVGWPFSLYAGGLSGLQRMVALNAIVTIATIFRTVGSVLVLTTVSQTVESFFIFQLVASLFQSALAGVYLRRAMPPIEEAVKPGWQEIRHLAGFASGVSGATIIGVLLSQADKIILSKFLSLEMFGYYALANTAATSLARVFGPISTAVYPKMSALQASGDTKDLILLYNRSCQLMAVVTAPVAITVSMFSRPLLQLWTGNSQTALAVSGFLSILVLGAAANGMLYLPYALQWSYNKSQFTLAANSLAAFFFVPLLLILVPLYGGMAAASLWLLVNLLCVLVSLPIMHLTFLRKSGWPVSTLWSFLWNDSLLPFAAAAIGSGLVWLVFPGGMSKAHIFLMLICAGTLSLTSAVLAARTVRNRVIDMLCRFLQRKTDRVHAT